MNGDQGNGWHRPDGEAPGRNEPGPAAPRLDPTGFTRQAFADQLSIETPEQVALQFPLAGLGSRFVALLLDHLIQFGVVLAFVLVVILIQEATGAHDTRATTFTGKWFIAAMIFAGFLLFWGYFSLFEAFWRGQTAGKRVMKLRVIKDAGRQITLFESLARNLLRVADYLPSLYLAGAITMLCNRRNKRLGDLAAGTLVIHERTETQPLLYTGPSQTSRIAQTARPAPGSMGLFSPNHFAQPPADTWNPASAAPPLFPADAVARLSSKDLVLLETFFARALDLPLDTRAAMAQRIATDMTAKMGVTLPEGNPERALEAMAIALRGRARRF